MDEAAYRAAVDTAVGEGRGVAVTSGQLRASLRRRVRKSNPERQVKLGQQLERINAVMVEVRSLLGGLLHHDAGQRREAALRETSRRLQYERRQLKKMLR